MTTFRIKRIYEAADTDDGYRVLVDRLWPRGISKDAAALDEWCQDIAPSNELRSWFSHDPERFDQFRKKYTDELNGCRQVVDGLRQRTADKSVVTILYGARDEVHNQAVVLRDYLAN